MPCKSGGPRIGNRGPFRPLSVVPTGTGIDVLEQIVHSWDESVILEVESGLAGEGSVAHQCTRRQCLLKVGARGVTHQDEILAIDAGDAIEVARA